MKKLISIMLTSCALVACNDSNSAAVHTQQSQLTPQDNVCDISEMYEAKALCTPGEIVYFEPNRWGNEQLPTTFIALACDTNKPIYFTKGGVVCTYVVRKSVNGKNIVPDVESSSKIESKQLSG